MLENVLQGHPFLKGDIVQAVHSFQNCPGCGICLVHAQRCTLLCSPTGPGCWGGREGGNKIVFTFYCVPAAAWLTEFVSPGSEAPKPSWMPSMGEFACFIKLVLSWNVSFHSVSGND